MALEPGTRLGHYEIGDPIGRGGMGEVYRGRDTKLGREVAIKTLPAEFASDTGRLARFEREARLLASLNHPNIAAIYGLEEHEGSRFLVLELVEGDTLADRLQRGAIPVEESLGLAAQIAAALEAAHDKGVVHRDLKPANIKVTSDGKVKVLDFGLAKAWAGDQPNTDLSNSPTLSMQATQAGLILGTAAYMAPEQARGKAVDKRADIWAFGVVLFEMVTGARLFEGEDLTDTLASVVKVHPDLGRAPAELRQALSACLEKDPSKRLRDIGDVWRLVEAGRATGPRRGTLRHTQWLWPPVAAVFAILSVVLWAPWREASLEPLVGWTVDLAEGRSLTADAGLAPTLSPDGTRVAFVASDGDSPPKIYTRRLDERGVTELAGTGKRRYIAPHRATPACS